MTKYNYKIQDIKCCLTCIYLFDGLEGSIECGEWRPYEPIDALGICDKYKKEDRE